MTRSTARRPGAVQAEKSIPPAPTADASVGAPISAPASGVPWYWQLVMFLWITSFVGLLLYEWLAGLFKKS